MASEAGRRSPVISMSPLVASPMSIAAPFAPVISPPAKVTSPLFEIVNFVTPEAEAVKRSPAPVLLKTARAFPAASEF